MKITRKDEEIVKDKIVNSIQTVLDDIRRQGAYMGDDHKYEWNKKVDKIEEYIKKLVSENNI